MTPTRDRVLNRSVALVAGLMIQAVAAYLTLIIAGRLLGAARFSGVSALYVLISSVPAGLFLPVELEIARRRGHEREDGRTDPGLIRRATLLSLAAALVLVVVAIAAHRVTLQLLDGDRGLLAALCVGLPGYACCFVSRGMFAGTGELTRYGVQLGVEGVSRLVGVLVLALASLDTVDGVGWLFGAAPWVALAVSLLGRHRPAAGAPGPLQPLLRPLGWLLVSSLAAQLLVNAGPIVIQLLATSAERAQAGAYLAALVIVRVPVFLFTAVQPSFLPAMAAHASGDRRAEFTRLLRRVLVACGVLTVLTTGLMAGVGPVALRLLFGFHHGVDRQVFLAMGLSVGLFLAAAVLAQALLGRGRHARNTLGWLVGIAGLAAGTAISASAVARATIGFLAGAVFAALSFSILMTLELRSWRLDPVQRSAV